MNRRDVSKRDKNRQFFGASDLAADEPDADIVGAHAES